LASLVSFFSEKSSESGLILVRAPEASTVYYPSVAGESTEDSSSGIKPVKLSLVFTGRYPSLKNFIRLVESSSRLIRVSRVFADKDSDSNLYIYKIDFEASFYQN
jgi:hypothetical protein